MLINADYSPCTSYIAHHANLIPTRLCELANGRLVVRIVTTLVFAMFVCLGFYCEAEETSDNDLFYVMRPIENPDALRNPLKGFRPDIDSKLFPHRYATIARCYLKWNELENDRSDDISKIKEVCDRKWASLANRNIKVIPRVYLDWNGKDGRQYWPDDMEQGDYSSEEFKQRINRLIDRLGECWDEDPRVAWVQMGIVGYWGEHHHPKLTDEMQRLLGEAFTRAFKNKKVLVRHADEFNGYEFGVYWDSWAHVEQTNRPQHGTDIEKLNQQQDRWKTHPIEGEVAYNWGDYHIQPGDNPDDTLSDPVHRDFLIDTIRNLHCTGLGWVADYSQDSKEVQQGAEEVQKAFGYRFVIDQFSCSRRVEPGGTLKIKFQVRNTGSAPFYEKWPLELSLLNPSTGTLAWSTAIDSVDIRKWLPGDNWDEDNNVYLDQPITNTIDLSIALPDSNSLKPDEYVVALAILDPHTSQPSIRFAIKNYVEGGRHPFCLAGVGTDVQNGYEIPPLDFAKTN